MKKEVKEENKMLCSRLILTGRNADKNIQTITLGEI